MRYPATRAPRNSARFLRISFLLAATLLLSACPVKFIGDYDDTIDKGVLDVQEKTELYFTKLKADPPPAFDQQFYDDINAKLAVLKSRATLMPRYPIVRDQLGLLQSSFADLQKLDKMRPFPPKAIDTAKTLIDASIESIERLELALKAGKATAPALTGK